MIVGLAIAWGLVVSAPFAIAAARPDALRPRRVEPHAGVELPVGTTASTESTVPIPGRGFPGVVRRVRERAPRREPTAPGKRPRMLQRRAARAADARFLRDLPILVEVLGVAIAAGSTPLLALEQSRRWVPPRCGPPIDDVLRAHRLGAAFPVALERGFGPIPAFAPLVDALSATERLGVAVGPELATVASGCRDAQRRAAEQRARSMSIRLLFPLVFLVLPAFGLLTVVPVLVAGLHRL